MSTAYKISRLRHLVEFNKMRNIERNQNFLRKIESTNRRITETLTTSKKFDDTIETKYESKAEINRGFNTIPPRIWKVYLSNWNRYKKPT